MAAQHRLIYSNITPKANYARILIPVTPDPTFTICLVIEKLERNSGCTVRVKLENPDVMCYEVC